MRVTGEILLVDDTPENLQVLGALLRQHGLVVRVAASGAMALRSVKARRPDLILLDVRMPEMDGFETCQRLRMDSGLLGVPILFLSASDAVEDRIQAFRVGGEDFISKPFQAEEVLARVTTHLSLAGARRDLDLANARLAEQVLAETHLRSAAESAAAERQARLELTLAAATMGAWEVEADAGEVDFDTRARQILGLPPGHRPNWRDFLRCIPEASEQGITKRWERSRRRQDVYELEGWWRLPEGRDAAAGASPGRRRIRLRGRPLPGVEGRPERMAGVIWDITEEFLLRERMVQGERLEALGLLAGGVAHDFNNQLAVILGEVEILELAGVPAEAKPHLDTITGAVQASTALIRDLLTFARRRDLERTTIDLAAVARRAAHLATRVLGTSIRCVTAIPAEPVWVSANAGQLENAILNLCINARDAMPDGGQLEIRLEAQQVPSRWCQVAQAEFTGTYAVVAVADTGTGIAEEIRGRIFEPFFTTKSEGKGTGLGLAAVLGCVAAHQGHLTLDTALGSGSTFAIHLPLAAAVAAAPAPAAAPAGARSGRLLLLDDQATLREVIADGLRRFGWEVVAFGDPDQAIAAWRDASPRFDVALVDMVMPAQSGAKVFRALRQLEAQAKVVLMSGHAGGENLEALRREGLAGFVDKPVKLRHLAEVLGGLLQGDRA
jgi:CheY-like chemotaxis protein